MIVSVLNFLYVHIILLFNARFKYFLKKFPFFIYFMLIIQILCILLILFMIICLQFA